MTRSRIRRQARKRRICLETAMLVLFLATAPMAIGEDDSAGAQIGGEVRSVEEQILKSGEPPAPSETPPEVNIEVPKPEQPPAAPPEEPAVEEERLAVSNLTVAGDSDILDSLKLREQLEGALVGQSLTMRQIMDVARTFQDKCVKAGFYLAVIRVPPAAYNNGELTLLVDKGRIGRMSFYDGKSARSGDKSAKTPFRSRFFSEAQLRRRMRAIGENEAFDYNRFYKSVFGINTHPDLVMDTDLKVRKEISEDGQRRFVDMDFFVTEHVPLHGVFEFSNTGTKQTDEWRALTTLQYLNLTRHDDVATINFTASPDFSTMLSGAANYSVPYLIGNGGDITLFGGYSEIDAVDIVPDVNIQGTGQFIGLQLSYQLITNERHMLWLYMSGIWRTIEDNLVFAGCENDPSASEVHEATVIPLSLAVSYSTVKPDALDGRNFITSQSSYNVGEMAGGSDADELNSQREGADADYLIERLQLARLQPLPEDVTPWATKRNPWMLFGKVEGQLTGSALIPVEQVYMGGMTTVRGYVERDISGDSGAFGSLELRTPLISGLLPKGAAATAHDRLQFLAFVDGAYLTREDSYDSGDDNAWIAGAGPGIRLGLTSYAQARFDWGFPFEETAESDSSGRGHVSVRAQF